MAIKIGVIGLGKIAQDQHLPCIQKNPDFTLAAVVSSRPSNLGVPAFKTPAEMLKGADLDAVAICTPPSVRRGIALECLEAGVHLLLEKPPTQTISEFVDLKAKAAASGKVAFQTWHSRFNTAVTEAKKLLSNQEVTRLHVSWKESVWQWHPGQEWIWEPGGFGVFDPGINALSIVTEILPEPIFVESADLITPANRFTPIAANVVFRPANGGKADLFAEFDWRQTGEQSWNIDVDTADMKLKLTHGGTKLYVNGALKAEEPSEEYEEIYARFANLVKFGTSEMDGSPLEIVADCMMLGRRKDTENFVW
ncbi:MAG: Gfo/Idh/MocA family protein [Rhizobiaceae bacterium]